MNRRETSRSRFRLEHKDYFCVLCMKYPGETYREILSRWCQKFPAVRAPSERTQWTWVKTSDLPAMYRWEKKRVFDVEQKMLCLEACVEGWYPRVLKEWRKKYPQEDPPKRNTVKGWRSGDIYITALDRVAKAMEERGALGTKFLPLIWEWRDEKFKHRPDIRDIRGEMTVKSWEDLFLEMHGFSLGAFRRKISQKIGASLMKTDTEIAEKVPGWAIYLHSEVFFSGTLNECIEKRRANEQMFSQDDFSIQKVANA